MAELIEPKDIEVEGLGGVDKVFTISKVPATVGREIVAKYPISALPKLGDYAVNEEIMFKMLAYVSVKDAKGNSIPLKTRALVDNHVPDWKMLATLELEMLDYNTAFLSSGKASKLLSSLKTEIQEWISKTLTGSLERYSQQSKQRSKNSKQNTP